MGDEHDGLTSVAVAGDINSDGVDDLVFGAPSHDGGANNGGAAYIVYNGEGFWGAWWDPATGEPRDEVLLSEAVAAEASTARIYATDEGDELGLVVDGAGDINGDGIDDVVLGASPSGGTVRVFFGGGT